MGVPFCWEVKEQLSNQGQTAVCEQAGSLQLCSSPSAGIKAPAAKCKHPRPAVLISEQPSALASQKCLAEDKNGIQVECLLRGMWYFRRWEPQRQIIFAQRCQGKALWHHSGALLASCVLCLNAASPLYHVKHESSHKKPLRGLTQRRIQSPGRRHLGPWNSAEGSFRGFKWEAHCTFHVLSWEGLNWKLILSKKYKQGRQY